MSIRKARAWATLFAGILIGVLALIVEVLTMPKYNGYDLPVLPESEYENAFIAVSGDTAYLYFVDKKGYIEVDPNGLGNTYTLGLTTTDPYDESKILFAEKYTATIGGDSWTAEELPDLSGVYDIPAYAQFALPCEIGGPVWSNVTLLDQNGDVFIKGSQPIDVVAAARRRYSFTLGYLMGVCGPVVSFPEKQPTAYSYNGVVLPKLPEVPEGYEFKCLLEWKFDELVPGAFEKGDYVLRCFTEKLHRTQDGGITNISDSLQIYFVYYDGVWNKHIDNDAGKVSISNVLWTNTDICNESDGTVYMRATAPIPIYE